jgi:hypothetical protein
MGILLLRYARLHDADAARLPCPNRHGRLSFHAQAQPRFMVWRHRCIIADIAIRQIDRHDGSAEMAVTQAIPITRHPYADGSCKKMLIDGKWVKGD